MPKSKDYPKVSIDSEFGIAAITLAPGIEAKSYVQDGFLFSENADGEIIEIQILNVSSMQRQKSKRTPKTNR
jgi:hypothetical protein